MLKDVIFQVELNINNSLKLLCWYGIRALRSKYYFRRLRDQRKTRSQSYQTLFFFVFRFTLLSLSVCNKQKKCVYYTTAKLSSKKWKNSSFLKKKSLVGLTPALLCQSSENKRDWVGWVQETQASKSGVGNFFDPRIAGSYLL